MANPCEMAGRAVTYAVYNLGVGIIIGMVRTAISVAYIAKHWLYNEAIQNALQKQRSKNNDHSVSESLQRNQNVRQKKGEYNRAKGVNKLVKGAQLLNEQTKQFVGDLRDDLNDEVIDFVHEVKSGFMQNVQQTRMQEWDDQLKRGILEIFWIGAPIYTYGDNLSGKQVSLLGLEEIAKKIETERQFDQMVHSLVPQYNPWF